MSSAILHFLNVLDGDCSIIQHLSGRITVIDVNNASLQKSYESALLKALSKANYQQKNNPENPIEYMKERGIDSVFRFILTHPDMDHMGGIKDLFSCFSPTNFWDTDNTEEKEFEKGSPYSEADWNFYKELRDGIVLNPKRLVLYENAKAVFYNKSDENTDGGDGLYILSPNKMLVEEANETEDYNDSSYVILYKSNGGKVLFSGDSHDKTWEHLIKNHKADISDIDILIAPHHGRKSDRDFGFLDIVKPKLTLFGNAKSEHLAYQAWSYRNLPYITNNQAGSIIIKLGNPREIFVTNYKFAKDINNATYFDQEIKGYFLTNIF